MSADLVSDGLWERVVPLLPVDDRAALRGIVLRRGVSGRDVPAERVGCSGVTAWRRLRDWTEAGVWPRLHEALLAKPLQGRTAGDGRTPRSTARTSGPSKGGPHRAFAGRPRQARSKHHIIVDRRGTPLAACYFHRDARPTALEEVTLKSIDFLEFYY